MSKNRANKGHEGDDGTKWPLYDESNGVEKGEDKNVNDICGLTDDIQKERGIYIRSNNNKKVLKNKIGEENVT